VRYDTKCLAAFT